MWCIGFELHSLDVAHWLSGLVDVHYIEFRPVERHLVVFFYVSYKDKTGTLFNSGALRAQKIDKFYKDFQPWNIDISNCVTNYSA